ncbi:DUF4249 domain-containing protein [Ferruginibacter sp. HRS2-29]|uniref:DUF4249 domain-containing protein n=1 Tax=Ferruginibacter sp. HRS2-29 TaxID=2487334 RepID=UPI0020CD4C76|nr:DUF4249 domain-containing protein [Ferruginibacter sp. HRS2-29]MCP9752042.1 DUF4249 domain-containing protein [Ferruginibacter sp. HRS2-29]
MRKWFIAVLAITLASCEKDINFNLAETSPVLVVDAQIENELPPTVVLTKSLSYFSNISPDLLANTFVHNADIYISNGVLTHKMKEYSYPLVPGFTGYYYGIDSSSLATAFTGAYNTSYSLRIVSEGKEYTAQTTIPVLRGVLDSVWTKPAPQNPDTNKRVLFVRGTDPAGRGDYARYFTKVNSGPFLAGENSVFDDQVIDGTTFDVQLERGIDRNDPPKSDSNFFKKGDTITVKFANINKATYTFWNTWEFAYQSIGNPFAQPNKVIGNVSNGALGVFAGYGAVYRRIIAN